jgi:hypothetical protein
MDFRKEQKILIALRDHAIRATAETGRTIAEWRYIRANWREMQTTSMAIREETRQARQQVRLSVAHSRSRRTMTNGLRSADEGNSSAAALDQVAAHSDELHGQGVAPVSSNAPLV